MKISTTLFLLSIADICFAQNKTYYISSNGNDANNGLSKTSAWQTIAKVNAMNFDSGDSIFFEGGGIFTGNLSLGNDDQGTASDPIVIASYGGGKASINAAGAGNGLFAYNTGGIEVRNLLFYSNGPTANNHNGVEFFMDQTSGRIEHIVIDNVEVWGFGTRGISIGAWGTDKGYDNVRIVNSIAHDNGQNGIETYGNWPQYSHSNFYIGYCKAYNNYGRQDYTSKHSGSGIIISGVDTAMIEYCEAYSNGKNNRHIGGGPVGIWFYDTKNGIIQYSESHHNEAGLESDGGGFDIDGGSQNCIIQYCYSHDNDGAGYGMFEYGSPNSFINNVIRYNISQNDGRKNGYGALGFWGLDASHKLINCRVYNNTFFVSTTSASQTPCGVKFTGNNMSGLNISNNIFYITGGVTMIKSSMFMDTTRVHFKNNNYYTTNNNLRFEWNGTSSFTLGDWKLNSSGQEMEGSKSLGITTDPFLLDPGNGQTIHPADGGNLSSVAAYQIQSGSALINKGLNLQSYGINVGTRDYFNNLLYSGTGFEIGANEFDELTYTFLPLEFIKINGVIKEGVLKLQWTIDNNHEVEKFIIQTSADGSTFQPVEEFAGNNTFGMVDYKISVDGNFLMRPFCRVLALNKNSKMVSSKIVKLNTSHTTGVAFYPNPVLNNLNISFPPSHTFEYLIIRNIHGSQITSKKEIKNETFASINLQNLISGIYIIELGTGLNKEFYKILKR